MSEEGEDRSATTLGLTSLVRQHSNEILILIGWILGLAMTMLFVFLTRRVRFLRTPTLASISILIPSLVLSFSPTLIGSYRLIDRSLSSPTNKTKRILFLLLLVGQIAAIVFVVPRFGAWIYDMMYFDMRWVNPLPYFWI